jgi:hypothetical protein
VSFEIQEVDPKSVVGDEQLGSKNKFWFQKDDERWLFKEARPNTGEDWAEKIAAEVAPRLDIPCARVELAEFQGRRGVACLSFVSEKRTMSLVHGNEILAGQIVGYDRDKKLQQSDHTLANIVTAVSNLTGSSDFSTESLQLLARYFVLDALIGNTDRHHENWAFLLSIERSHRGADIFLQVAPSFDHASSLGRELTDERRAAYLKSAAVGQYAKRATGGIFLDSARRKGASPLALVQFGLQQYPNYFGPALSGFRSTSLDGILAVVDEVPKSRMSATAKTFAKELLTFTHGFLLELQS